MSREFKVGLFVLLGILVVVVGSVVTRESGIGVLGFGHGQVRYQAKVDSAEGVAVGSFVKMRGIPVGSVETIGLGEDGKHVILKLAIDDRLKLSKDVAISKEPLGLLGNFYINLIPGIESERLQPGDEIERQLMTGSLQEVMQQVAEIGRQVNELLSAENRAKIGNILSNADLAMASLAQTTQASNEIIASNRASLATIIGNLERVSGQLVHLVGRGDEAIDSGLASVQQAASRLDESLRHVEEMTRDVKEGHGTIGKLLRDEETVDRLNEVLENTNELVGRARRFQTSVDYHMEYLPNSDGVISTAGSGSFKNFVGVKLQPRPDKYFWFEVVDDPQGFTRKQLTRTIIDTGGTPTVVTTEEDITDINRLRLSFQFAKRFWDLTVRAGVIESTGGLGFDYNPYYVKRLNMSLNLFDFQFDDQRTAAVPQDDELFVLKALASYDLMQNLYLVGGLDDIVNRAHREEDPSWFLGAGLKFSDDDIKSLFSFASLGN